jgi:outer membrane protein OmpA-like peptidoglycan-associated protein
MFAKKQNDEADSWLSISDLMSGLMIIFLFIAILYIQPLQKIKINVEGIATAWREGEADIYAALQSEFSADLTKWNAELDKEDLVFRFKSPDLLFDTGSDQMKPEFRKVLSDFFPRYLRALKPFVDRGFIEEIRIEGHTSSVWTGQTADEAYFLNMGLSQDRTRSVLRHALTLQEVAPEVVWARPLVTANGLSSSRPILTTDGREDDERSRRVDFRIRTTTQNRLNEIVEQFEGGNDADN